MSLITESFCGKAAGGGGERHLVCTFVRVINMKLLIEGVKKGNIGVGWKRERRE